MNHHHHHQQQQQEEEEEEEEENNRNVRWFDLLLSVVAAVVAVLAMAVLIGAVMLRWSSQSQLYLLEIKVLQGAVRVEFQSLSSMTLYFDLVAFNPITNRPSNISFTSIDIAINNGDYSMPVHIKAPDYIVGLKPGHGIGLQLPHTMSDKDVGNYFFGKLKKNDSIPINLRLEGVLTTQYLIPFNDAPVLTIHAIYNCFGVVLGVNSSLNNNGNDVSCSQI